jgi:hypothetical protein
MSQTSLAEAYARLQALKSNLPDAHEVDEKYVQEFHLALELLEPISGYDLSRFRVPLSEVHPQVSGRNYVTGKVYYSGRKVCERSFMMMKVDSVLGFFQIQTAPRKGTIGFKPT